MPKGRKWTSQFKKRNNLHFFHLFYFFYSGPQQIGQCLPILVRPNLLYSLLIQMLISSRNTLTDKPRNIILPAIYIYISLVGSDTVFVLWSFLPTIRNKIVFLVRVNETGPRDIIDTAGALYQAKKQCVRQSPKLPTLVRTEFFLSSQLWVQRTKWFVMALALNIY